MIQYLLKRITTLFSVILISAGLLQSCVAESLPLDEELLSAPILVFSSDFTYGAETKTSLNGNSLLWVEGDKIGIFSPHARTAPASSEGVNNVIYSAVSSTSSSEFTGNMYWGEGPHNFYSYYPHIEGSFNAQSVPVTLPSVQVQTGESNSHLSQYDMLIANPLLSITPGDTGDASSVDFKFNHLFTLLEFRIVSLTDKIVSEVEIVAPEGTKLSISSGTVDITSSTPGSYVPYILSGETGSNSVKVTVSGGVVSTRRYSTTPSVFMMINPNDLSSQSVTINVKDIENNLQTLTRTGINFKRGVKYLVKVAEDGMNPNDPEANLGGTVLFEEL